MLKDSSDYKLAFLGIFFRKFEFTNKIKKLLKIADLKIPIDFFFIITGGLFLPFFLISIISKSFLFSLISCPLIYNSPQILQVYSTKIIVRCINYYDCKVKKLT